MEKLLHTENNFHIDLKLKKLRKKRPKTGIRREKNKFSKRPATGHLK